MEDRTPTLEKLEQIKSSLDGWVNRIYQEVPFTSLNKDAMLRIMKYMGNNFSQEDAIHSNMYKPIDILALPSGVLYFDIGYRLIKDQLERESQLTNDEKRVFFDGVMGWLSYNPGSIHTQEMDKVVLEYVRQFGVNRLNSNFDQIYKRFESLIAIAQSAKKELDETHSNEKELAYWKIFSECKFDLGFRVRSVREIVHGFYPNFS